MLHKGVSMSSRIVLKAISIVIWGIMIFNRLMPAQPARNVPASEVASVVTGFTPRAPAVAPVTAPVVPTVPESKRAAEPAFEAASEKAMRDQERAKKVQEQPLPPAERLIDWASEDLYQKPGNYVRKNKALTEALDNYEQLLELLGPLEDSREQFFNKRSESNLRVNKFFAQIGFDREQLEKEISRLITELEKERVAEGELTEQERDILAELTAKKEALEQLRLDIRSIVDLDNSLGTALAKLNDQIAQARKIQDESLRYYKRIDELRDDKEALDLAHRIGNFVSHLRSVQSWAQGPFASYFNQTIDTITAQIAKITAQIKTLRAQGLLLEKEVEQAKKEDIERKTAEEKARLLEEQKKKEALLAQRGIFTRITDAIQNFWTSVRALFPW